MRYNYCANPLRCCKENRVFGAIRWKKIDHVSYYTDDKLYSMMYTPNSYYW